MRRLSWIVFSTLFALSAPLLASATDVTSTSFQNFDSTFAPTVFNQTSTHFQINGAVESITGLSQSASFKLVSGVPLFDPPGTPTLSLTVGTQENTTQTAYSAFSTSTKIVTVASVAGFSVGNLIGVVENIGLSEKVAVGRIVLIVGNDITVDAWDGDPNSLSGTPAGGNDFVYRLNGYSAVLGTLTTVSAGESLTAVSVSSTARSGYTAYVNDDGNLRLDATHYIQNVAGGSVAVGTEAYGGHVFGTNATSTGLDFPFATTTRAIQQSTAQALTEERSAVVYKASVDAGTPAGKYSHVVYYTVTANF